MRAVERSPTSRDYIQTTCVQGNTQVGSRSANVQMRKELRVENKPISAKFLRQKTKMEDFRFANLTLSTCD